MLQRYQLIEINIQESFYIEIGTNILSIAGNVVGMLVVDRIG
jgi:hypothetical protein